MIVYNVKRRWFAMKVDADKYRLDLRLKPEALSTIRVETREELADLLDALCATPAGRETAFQPAGNAGKAPLPIVYDEVEVPDFIPAFLLKDGKRRV